MAIMTVSEARAALPEVLNRVTEGEEITITRHGQAVAVIVRPDIMWSRSRAEDALAEARTALSMDPANAEAYRYLGLALYANGHYDAAVHAFDESKACTAAS